MHQNTRQPLILASASPRRAELLGQLGIPFLQFPVDIDESVRPGEQPQDYVRRLAVEKAEAALLRRQAPEGTLALGSDTSVVLGDRIFGKPGDEAECLEMLEALSGQVHSVLTGIAMARPGQETLAQVVTTQVWFRKIERDEMRAYWYSGEPVDKAGGYAIQGKGAVFVQRIEGSYSAVMGLPVFETAEMLCMAGYELWSVAEEQS